MNKIKITEYKNGYDEKTVTMWRQSMEAALQTESRHSFEDHLNFYQNVVTKNNSVYLAIETSNQQVVGFMAQNGSDLDQLYIHVDYQQQGIGTQLLNMAKDKSLGNLYLYTFEVNKIAQNFYEKHGFNATTKGFEEVWQLADVRYEWKDSNKLKATAYNSVGCS